MQMRSLRMLLVAHGVEVELHVVDAASYVADYVQQLLRDNFLAYTAVDAYHVEVAAHNVMDNYFKLQIN